MSSVKLLKSTENYRTSNSPGDPIEKIDPGSKHSFSSYAFAIPYRYSGATEFKLIFFLPMTASPVSVRS